MGRIPFVISKYHEFADSSAIRWHYHSRLMHFYNRRKHVVSFLLDVNLRTFLIGTQSKQHQIKTGLNHRPPAAFQIELKSNRKTRRNMRTVYLPIHD